MGNMHQVSRSSSMRTTSSFKTSKLGSKKSFNGNRLKFMKDLEVIKIN